MKRTLLGIMSAVLPLIPLTAAADWAEPGAVLLCDTKSGTFSVRSVMDTSDPQDKGTVLAPAGYSAIVTDENYSCKLGNVEIRTSFRVRPPQATGMCGGMKQTYIESMRVNGTPIFEPGLPFNHRCLEEIALYSIDVHSVRGMVSVKTCYAKWDWGVGYTVTKCDEASPLP